MSSHSFWALSSPSSPCDLYPLVFFGFRVPLFCEYSSFNPSTFYTFFRLNRPHLARPHSNSLNSCAFLPKPSRGAVFAPSSYDWFVRTKARSLLCMDNFIRDATQPHLRPHPVSLSTAEIRLDRSTSRNDGTDSGTGRSTYLISVPFCSHSVTHVIKPRCVCCVVALSHSSITFPRAQSHLFTIWNHPVIISTYLLTAVHHPSLALPLFVSHSVVLVQRTVRGRFFFTRLLLLSSLLFFYH